MKLPTHCYSCGAYLKGSLTEHKPECAIRKLIEEHFSHASPGARLNAENAIHLGHKILDEPQEEEGG